MDSVPSAIKFAYNDYTENAGTSKQSAKCTLCKTTM